MFTNTDNVIDSRDVIGRIEELEEIKEALLEENPSGSTVALWLQGEDGNEYQTLLALADECSNLSNDWEYGESLIHEDYFEQYMDDMVVDCYELPKDLPWWMSLTSDYDALKQDYTEVDFNGKIYYIRSV